MSVGNLPADEQPSQTVMWNSYGHALAAATCLDCVMRFALYAACDEKFRNDAIGCEKAKKRYREATFGQTAGYFRADFTGLGANKAFCDDLKKAVRYRNLLAHHFLEKRMLGLQSEEGLRTLTVELSLSVQHFSGLEATIRQFCPLPLLGYILDEPSQAQSWARSHPLFTQAKEWADTGQLEPLALVWWDEKF